MAKNKRVFEIAKELTVQSKDIVTKCADEGVPGVSNHMSSVSAGLEATIREWFTEGEGAVTTAVQTTTAIDVTEVRAKAKKKAARKKKPTATTETAAATPSLPKPTATSVTDDALSPTTTAPKAEVRVEPPDPESSPQETPEAPVKVAAEVPPSNEKPAEIPALDTPAEPDIVMNVPDRPSDIYPVGPMLQEPRKTQLSGPKVIRIEAPDNIPAPRPRREVRPGVQPVQRGGPRGGRGSGDDAGGRPIAGGDSHGQTSKRNKRRSGTSPSDGRRSTRGLQDAQKGSNWRKQDLIERKERLNRSGGFFITHRRDAMKQQQSKGKRAETPLQKGGKVEVSEPITIKSLSAATGVKAADILRKLLMAGMPTTINSSIETDKALEVMLEYDIELEVIEQKTAEDEIRETFRKREMQDERLRAPVVTILGHVDHGKTSLLDKIRRTNVAEGEAGGITQATSAFRVPVKAGDQERVIVFFDTPGHEAFTEMRARGARVTDLVVLVVAADDGVMPQTLESINHAKAAGVPIIIALNKIDKPEATDQNIQRILGQFAEHELNPVEWGGETEVVRTSAVKGEGIQELLDHIDFAAQLHEWKADFAGPAEGSVIEAQMQEGRGPVARILVQQGHLKRSDFIVIGRAFGRIRDIVNDRGDRIDECGPSSPVAISGINTIPDAGDKFFVVDSLKAAEAAANERRDRDRQRELAVPRVTLDNIFERMQEGERKELNLIIRADVQGAVETLKSTLTALSLDEVKISILHAAVGGITENDVTLAAASNAIAIGFNVTTSAKARKAAEQKGIDIRLYDVIYDITDDVEKAAKGMLEPEHRLDVLGHAEVRQVFKVSKVGMIAGCYVTDGIIERSAQIRVTRDGIVVEADRRLDQLKRFKDDAREVRSGQECGMKIDGYNDIKAGDVLECYKTVEVRPD